VIRRALPILLAPLALAIVLLGAPASTSAAPAGATEERRPVEIYRADCSYCHGIGGQGTNQGPTLEGVGRASVDYYLTSGRMPLVEVGRTEVSTRPLEPLPGRLTSQRDLVPRRHEPAYSPATIALLVDYVGDLAADGGPDVPDDASVADGDLAEGGKLFRLQCAACHAATGAGGALSNREAPALQPATPKVAAEAIRVGPGQMPAFGTAAMTDEQVASVVSYVQYLDDPRDRGGQPLLHLGPVAEGGVALLTVFVLLAFTRWIGERG
jgi:ubiquinol-cytochrome c reductase cytochrome c subunit